jgi:D-alanine-D-alanine ligase
MTKNSKKIAVLLGGMSAEREVSLRTGEAVHQALVKLGQEAVKIDVGHDVYEQLKAAKPDICYNALHGTFGEDGCIQGMLEIMQIPYTHSGVMASSVAMNKALSKRIFSTVGINMAGGAVLTRAEVLAEKFNKPAVIKPIEEGSSIGMQFVMQGQKVDADALPSHETFLVEDFIKARELSVAVLNGKGLGIVEIRPKGGVYDYKTKYTAGASEYLVPAPISEETSAKALEMAEKAHNVLGCRGVTRSDIMFDENSGKLYMLEINTHPGMTATSLVPKIAASQGMSFEDVVEAVLATAGLEK